ncbi:MAG: hypothetical protein Kow0099_32430 [Candidatus Abyssubacteria bacterium]
MMIHDEKWIRERIADTLGAPVAGEPQIITDTTEFMEIRRGHVLKLDGRLFLVTGNVYEPRFGLSDEPKYWVKKAVDLASGGRLIVKLAHYEEFFIRISRLRIRCYRDPHKESRVLDLVRGNPHFMQGESLFDERGNEVRIAEFIRGKTIFQLLLDMQMSHEEYFHTVFPGILRKLRGCFGAVQFLHDHGLCHGDIRNDHILIERETGSYRWIDFDLSQDFSDLDIWSIGNVLQFCMGMGMRTFREVFQSEEFPERVKQALNPCDASAFFEHRIMNLQKIFPYIPDCLNDILLHFTVDTTRFYVSVSQIVADIDAALEEVAAT